MFQKPTKRERRTESVTLMITKDEREMIDRIVRESGYRVSDLLRIGLRKVVDDYRHGVLTDER